MICMYVSYVSYIKQTMFGRWTISGIRLIRRCEKGKNKSSLLSSKLCMYNRVINEEPAPEASVLRECYTRRAPRKEGKN